MRFTALNSLKSRAVEVKHGITNRANGKGEPVDLTILFQHLCKADNLLPKVTLLRYQSWFYTKARILVLWQPFLPVVAVIKHINCFLLLLLLCAIYRNVFLTFKLRFIFTFAKQSNSAIHFFISLGFGSKFPVHLF